VELELTPAARAWLAEHGLDPANGARPLARLIEERILRPLGDELLFGTLEHGGVARVDARDGQIVLAPEGRPGAAAGVSAGQEGNGVDGGGY
jgi:ATP-dependent Clp protease ATP-binding subunit ClpA